LFYRVLRISASVPSNEQELVFDFDKTPTDLSDAANTADCSIHCEKSWEIFVFFPFSSQNGRIIRPFEEKKNGKITGKIQNFT